MEKLSGAKAKKWKKSGLADEKLRIENDYDLHLEITECSITLSIREFNQNYWA